jgi:hypothetical protein
VEKGISFPGQKAPRTLIPSCQGGKLGVVKYFKGFPLHSENLPKLQIKTVIWDYMKYTLQE